jgi:MoaA/NifB/PqqE/SkfB family radical SAM enzyme
MEIIEVKQEGWSSDLLRVDVTIGNICNFKCWYCWPSSNAGNIKWPDFQTCVDNLSHLLDHYLETTNKKRFDFHIMGGEVTHWKYFIDFIKYFKERYDCIFTLTTNASKNMKWWEKAYPYIDYVNISVHNEYTDAEHTKNVADFLYEKNVYVIALVLMDPFKWSKCMSIVDTLKTSKHRWTIRYNEVVHDSIKYTEQQLKVLKKEKARYTNPFYFFRTNKSYRSKVKVIDSNRKKHSFKDHELVLKRLHNFKGWECDLGVDWIAIRADGGISGICGNGLYKEGKVYNLYAKDFKETFRPNIEPTVCKQNCCWCRFETNMSKRKI